MTACTRVLCHLHFNPRSPCGERRLVLLLRDHATVFQSTLPVRGATENALAFPHAADFNPRSPCGERRLRPWIPAQSLHFNPRSPCGERRETHKQFRRINHFNPRSPCGERQLTTIFCRILAIFQSTLPVRGATRCGATIRGGGAYFNPRSPCGERRGGSVAHINSCRFQSTLPVRGATIAKALPSVMTPISIHAPRAGSDHVPVITTPD